MNAVSPDRSTSPPPASRRSVARRLSRVDPAGLRIGHITKLPNAAISNSVGSADHFPHPGKIPNARLSNSRGFALVVTLSLMILLTVVAVGLLGLATSSLRTSSASADVATARSNARMALMLAIGDLQKHAGNDTRITARADVLDETNPPITGVWKSWEGTNHEQTGMAQGRPIAPGNYKTTKEDRFLSWLVSGDSSDLNAPPDTGKSSEKITLLGPDSVGSGADREKLQVHLTPVPIRNGSRQGSYSWWISGENQKARLPKPYEPSQDNNAGWVRNAKSHATADPKPFRMDALLEDPSPATKAISLKQSDLIAGKQDSLAVSQEFFHDLTAHSVGLLTNTATGGWKKDLSLLTENWAAAGTTNLPFFRVKPGEDVLANLPTTGNPRASKSMLYPWSSYRGTTANPPIYQHGAVASWENLKDYILAYRDKGMSVSTAGKASITPYSVAIDRDAYTFLHKVRVLPLIARIQWVFSHTSGPPANPAAFPAGSKEARLLLTPVITMWNPYNVEMQFNQVPLTFRLPKPLPAALKYSVNNVANTKFNSLTAGNLNNSPALSSVDTLNYQINTGFSLRPGETRVFSPSGAAVAPSVTLPMSPGYRSRGGHYFPILNDSGARIVAPATATIRAEARFDTTYDDHTPGIGIYLDMLMPVNGETRRHLAYRMVYTPQVASSIYPSISGLATSPPLSSIQANPSPFLTTVFGARMASRTHLAAKGFVQSSPLVNYTAMGGKDAVESTIQRHYGGTNHPVNSPFDYSFEKVAPNDSLLPNESDTTGRGYIVTGFTKADGLSRCVIAELPTRPIQSLAELQNWDLRYENPIPPFAFNLIGNSDASPLLPADAVVNPADANLGVNLQHDDAHCANHLLFDDWIFSTINRDPDTFGTGGRTIQKTFTDFVSGTSPLANRTYQPLPADNALAANSTANANALYTKHVAKPDAWKTIASRIEVEGMFNVNSTSVTAWRALLGHARNQKVPYMNESTGGWNVTLSGKSDHAFSRFSIAGGVEAGTSGSSGAFPEASEFSGYRILDEPMLDAMALEIVRQVRLRGPFLSLAEFVNRQLSSGELALAGTVQAALDAIAKSSATNPYKEITDVISRPSLATPPSAGDAEYKFSEAAVGQSTYGLPGWTRQADVLRAIAPVLSARDDTFVIRAHGDARDANGRISASAVCEAVVRRTREYVDPSDSAEITKLPASKTNQTFGRRFEIISFRWLGHTEI